jgi:hypothetical protein
MNGLSQEHDLSAVIEVMLRHSAQHEICCKRSTWRQMGQLLGVQTSHSIDQGRVGLIELIKCGKPVRLCRKRQSRPIFIKMIFDDISRKPATNSVVPEPKVEGDLPSVLGARNRMSCRLSRT